MRGCKARPLTKQARRAGAKICVLLKTSFFIVRCLLQARINDRLRASLLRHKGCAGQAGAKTKKAGLLFSYDNRPYSFDLGANAY
jgi:hypothetical protein